MMKKKDKYEVVLEGGVNMTYDKFIIYLEHGGEGRIRIGKQYIGILNIGQDDNELFPKESLFIFEDKKHNEQKRIYINKSDIKNYKLYKDMTLKELFTLKQFSIVSIF